MKFLKLDATNEELNLGQIIRSQENEGAIIESSIEFFKVWGVINLRKVEFLLSVNKSSPQHPVDPRVP